jgi:hypothetical protein
MIRRIIYHIIIVIINYIFIDINDLYVNMIVSIVNDNKLYVSEKVFLIK